MSRCERENVDYQLMSEAQRLVLGMVTARRCNNEDDASALVAGYMNDAKKRGVTEGMSWAVLFTAGVLWVDTLLECRAAHHGITHQEAVQELGLILVVDDD